jgi:hypothetical protein
VGIGVNSGVAEPGATGIGEGDPAFGLQPAAARKEEFLALKKVGFSSG